MLSIIPVPRPYTGPIASFSAGYGVDRSFSRSAPASSGETGFAPRLHEAREPLRLCGEPSLSFRPAGHGYIARIFAPAGEFTQNASGLNFEF